MNRRFQFLFVSSSLAAVLLLLVGVKLGRSANNSDDPYKHFGVFSEVITRIKSDYVEEPDMKNVTLGALNGLLESIDPFASYLNADQFKQYQATKGATKANVGLILSRRFGYVSVVDSIPGSPADKAGFNTGDMLETIKGISSRDMPLAFAEMLLMGDEGTTVEIQVLRSRKPEPEKVTLTRAKISYPTPVLTLGPDGVATFVVQSLQGSLKDSVKKGLDTAIAKGAKKLIIDLRNCATGEPADGVEIAQWFLDKGAIGSVKGQRSDNVNFTAEADKQIWKLPVVLIVNRGTATAAEVFAAALLENKRADLVGERTYGDASIRKALSLDDGSAVILSVAKYYAPNGKAIQDTGVTPNYPMLDATIGGDEDPDGDGIPNAPPAEKPKEDLLMKKAIELVNGNKTMAGINPDAALRR
ncbi:S41 family peptidase [Bryobacter aggregatus]|uniref:S41 family peptidase n=1 Tax=Bryobacter aggregatus TaxID=360054 RepID=UPI00068FBCA1|nr:S41 family peptidase [Bryobacter aggregatus]